MKKIIYGFIIITIFVSSCSIDNYNAPNASLTGKIVDSITNELIQQDLLNGSIIEYIELGYPNPYIQALNFHADGTYANLTMFAGRYKIQAVRGNYFTTPQDSIEIKGHTVYDFKTRPYLRIIETSVKLSADSSTVTSTFKIDNVAQQAIKEVGLYADQSPSVGFVINEASKVINLNSVGDPTKVYTVTLPTATLKKGKKYYFRIAAMSSINTYAKYNWAQAVPIQL